MKKGLLAICCLLLMVLDTSAQITLTESSYPAVVTGTDSLKMTVFTSAFPSLAATAGRLWDMSLVTDSVPLFYAWHLPDVTYQYADSTAYSVAGFAYQGNAQCSVTTNGILEYGVNVKKNEYTLTSLTSGLVDTLIIDSQNMSYSLPHTKIAFPATYNTKWSSAYSADLNFELSIAALGYNHAPGIMRRYTVEQDSVTGWGKMRVKDASGLPSDSFNVLQVQTTITTTDSFFLNGDPFSGFLLITLRLTQGVTDTIYQQNYYQPLEITPLAQVTFTDASYTQPKSALTHVKHMIGTTAVTDLFNKYGYQIYPNPVCGNIIYISLPAAAKQELKYELINVAGKTIKQDLLQTSGNRAELTLPSSAISGLYYLKLKNNDSESVTIPIDVMR